VHQTSATNSSIDCTSTVTIQSADSDAHVNSSLMTDMNCHAWNTITCDSVAQATLPILNPDLPRDNTCHHDSGVNHHIFHDRSTFKEYDSIAPLTVKGFGHDLSAMVIG